MIIERKSPVTGKTNTMDLPIEPGQIRAWQYGALIQDAMPHLTAEQREFIISGCTPEDWKILYGEEK